jgi:hypothetical protein
MASPSTDAPPSLPRTTDVSDPNLPRLRSTDADVLALAGASSRLARMTVRAVLRSPSAFNVGVPLSPERWVTDPEAPDEAKPLLPLATADSSGNGRSLESPDRRSHSA